MRGKDSSLNFGNTFNDLEDKKEKEKFQEKEKTRLEARKNNPEFQEKEKKRLDMD